MAQPQYGSEVGPLPPQDDMYAIDVLAGQTGADISTSPSQFTGGTGGAGLGGSAEPAPEGGPMKDRIGY
jgi:hypothetical protein